MSDRQNKIATFLAQTPYADWGQDQLAGDASSRRYIRLSFNNHSVILMDDETAGALHTFAKIANWLRVNSLAAPEIIRMDTANGLMILEDLGPSHLANWIADKPLEAKKLYAAATDVLINLEGLSPPSDLTKMTPVVGGAMLDVTREWYAEEAPEELSEHMSEALSANCGPPTTVALRDYHAENLIWRPWETGMNRIGLLDFQDAFLAPSGYDLVSLLRDVRRKVDPDLAHIMTDRFADGLGSSIQAVSASLATLAVQRNLRILGVFSRLARRDGKTRYLRMVPHLWDMLSQDLTHPALSELKRAIDATLPAPAHSAIKDLL